MRIGMVVFANKDTGAAAVAALTARALHRVGAHADLLFLAGRNLEERLDGRPWAEAGLVKERTPARVLHNLRRLRRFADAHDVVVCHLPHDQFLCVAAGVHRRAVLVRAFRHRRHLRADPFHRAVARPLRGAVLAHSAMTAPLRRVSGTAAAVTLPVPVPERFRPGLDGHAWRRRLDIPRTAPIVGMVGKLAAGRGFGLLLDAAARLPERTHVLMVGHGELQPSLERQSASLGLTSRVHFAGYQEEGLPELYSAMDVVLCLASGSDQGHRTVGEAQACGRAVLAARLPGVEDLLEDRVTGRLVLATPDAVAEGAGELLADPDLRRRLGEAAVAVAAARRPAAVGGRLASFLHQLVEGA